MLGLPKDKVILCPHNKNWTQCFIEEKQNIISKIGKYIVDVHHFGSTSIFGILAKPIIDIAVTVRTLEDVERCKQNLIKLGYECHGQIVAEGCIFFSKGNPTTHHIHFTENNNINMKKWLFFRDQLRKYSKFASEYQVLKQDLEQKYANDRKAYNSGKDEFIHKVLASLNNS